jgi:nitroimidazol reductase NimA-like FMN-containing flavoprotein (pyridoxamine 5'-phosphate oxidase superfamily)
MDVAELKARLGDGIAEGEDARDAGRVLAEVAVGYLAVEGAGWPYVVPINFAYDGSAVYFHGGGSLKAALLEADPRVCLAVTTQPRFMPGEGPCDDNFRYESVLVFGEVETLGDDVERDRVLRLIVEKYDPAARAVPFKPSTFKGTQVCALKVAALTYKRNPAR